MKFIKDLLLCGSKRNISVERDMKFSWRIINANAQRSFRLTVKKSRGKTVYDTGRIASSLSLHRVDMELERECDYVAILEVETDCGKDKARISFRTGVCRGFGGAEWIGRETSAQPILGGAPATYFKKEFVLEKGRQRAYLYIAGLGLFTACLNGKSVGDSVLNTPFTSYDKRVLYETYDVSSYLKEGVNTLTVAVGDGWSCQNTIDTWEFYRADFRNEHKLLARLVTDECIINSDGSWRVCQDGPITRSALRLGEYYDARRTPSYSENAVIKDAPLGACEANTMHPIKEICQYKYISAEKLPDGYLLDFGHNIAGYARVTLQGKPGQQVKLIYGDRLEGNDIDNTSNAQYIMDKEQNATFQTDIITLGEGRVRFSPSFVYHGFRYIKVLGLDRVPDRDEIVAVSVRTSFEKTGNFTSSSRIINKLQKMSQASQEANFVGIPTDCPHREKNGWTGDLQLSVEQLLYNYDCEADLRKYQRDICLCQTESGQIPCIAPTAENVFGYLWGSGPAWDVAMFVIPHQLFKATGDIGIIKEYLPYLINYCEYLEGKKDDDGLVGYGLGDWNPPRQCEVKAAPLKLTDSLYYMYMNQCVSLFCQKLGMDASIYTARADEMRARIKKTFVKRSGKVADGGACAEAAVIYFGVVKGEEKDKVFKRLLKTLKRDGYTMRFGILGSKYVFHVLCDNFRYDIALRMLKQSKYPSFANWIKRGAVTLWEDYEGTNSRNHYMYSDISAVFYKYIAGIDYEIRDGVQYNTIRVNRSCGERKAAADVMTPAGKLGIAQRRENGKLHVTLRLPPNSKSEFLFEDGTRAELPSAGEYEFDLINA